MSNKGEVLKGVSGEALKVDSKEALKADSKEALKVVSTKVSAGAYARMRELLAAKGLSIYEFLSGCCSMVLSYLDNPHDISSEMAVVIQLFEGISHFHNGFLLNGTDPYRVSDAIYFLQAQDKTGTHGVRVEVKDERGKVKGDAPVHISGEHDSLFCTEDFNRQHILERAVEGTTPELYRRLRLLGEQMGTSSFLETLTRLVEQELCDPLTVAAEELTGGNDYLHTKRGGVIRQSEQVRWKSTRNNSSQ